MPRATSHFLPLCLTLILVFATAAFPQSRFHEPSTTGGDVRIVTTSPERSVTRIQLQDPPVSTEEVTQGGDCFTDVWIEGESHTTEPGLPSLPLINRLVGVPDHGVVQLSINSAEYTEESGYRIYPFQGMEEQSDPQFRWNQDFYNQNAWYPSEIATLGEPAVFRDVRLVNLSICPVQYNPATGAVRTYHNIDVQVETVPGVGINEKTRSFAHPSSLFLPMYRELLNYQYLEMDEEPQPPGTCLIICADHPTPIGYANQLAEWKQRKGIPTRIATRTETGNTYAEIRAYIQTAYDTWDPPLEFVLLLGDDTGNIGDPFHVPAYGTGYTGSDFPYTQLAGDDILGDIAIGRLSANDAATMNLIVTKTLRYEQNPYLDRDWFTKAYLLAGLGYGVTSTITTMEYIRSKMYDKGFTEVVLSTHNGHINAVEMRSQLALGRSYFFSRPSWVGQMSTSDLNGLSNGWMLPFVVVVTSNSGDFVGSGAGLSEYWLRFGSIANGNGAVACIGSATSGDHTCYNNIIVAGIGHGIFVNDTPEPGIALMEGKLQLYRNYYPQESNYVTVNSQWKNLMGDPEVPIWSAFPTSFDVSYPVLISLGTNRVPVQVNDEHGDRVEGALVCLMKGDETWTRAYTDESGILEMPTGPETEGTLWLTVSKPNFVPFQADITVSQPAIYVASVDASIDDDTTGGTFGNGDGELNPGETVDLTITAQNFGDSVTATNVIGTLSSFDTALVQILVDQQSFPNLDPGTEAQSLSAFRIELSGLTQDQDHTPLLLSFASSQQTDTSLVNLTIVSGMMQLYDHRFLLSDNRLDPGETEQLTVTIENFGHRDLTNVQGHLFSSDPRITFGEPNAFFGSVAVGDTVSNLGDPFEITAASTTIPGHPTTIGLALSGADGFCDTIYVSFEVGLQRVWDPTGPDAYGYYCFDNGDTGYVQAPEYHWTEIDPDYGGLGEHLPIVDNAENEDDNAVQELPFTFRMYGVDYDSITICSNGWAALGSQAGFVNARNWRIPGAEGPDAMLAAFWDELVTSSGYVCWYYDGTEGYLIIEWSRVATLYNLYPETFEIILYDPNVWPTPSGDGLVKYQYRTINNVVGGYDENDYGTVGIEDHTQTVGLELTYWNTYSPGAAPLESGRAYLFTTLESVSSAEFEEPPAPLEYSLGQNYPNPFNPVTVIPYSIRETAHVTLTVYNVLGQKVATLVDEPQEAGTHRAMFDATSFSSGIYFYRLEAGVFTQTHKMVLLK